MEELKDNVTEEIKGEEVLEDQEEKDPRYEVVKTLIKGKQSAKKNINSKGNVKITYHKKPIGYVVKDLKTGELRAVSHLEVVQLVYDHGATNVFTTKTRASDGAGGKIISPYIRSKPGETTLQHQTMIVDPDVYLKENPEVKVSEELAALMARKVRRSGRRRDNKPKYSREALMKALKAKRAMLGLEVNKEEESSDEKVEEKVDEKVEEKVEEFKPFNKNNFNNNFNNKHNKHNKHNKNNFRK